MPQRRRLSRRSPRIVLAFLLMSLMTCAHLQAQRAPGRYKTNSISVFGGFQYDRISFTNSSGTGGAFGFDLTQHFLRVPLAVSLQGRANLVYGIDANEHSYVVGPRVEYGFGRFHPYGDFELGLGNIHFSPPIQLRRESIGDKSAIIAGGGGVDVDLFRNVAFVGDFQVQHWNIEPRTHQVFTPALATFGIRYTLPFRAFGRQGDPYYK